MIELLYIRKGFRESLGGFCHMEQKKYGDSNQITREYFENILLEMRQMGAVQPSTKISLFGEEFDTPIATAALSHLDQVCENGMERMARGAFLSNAVCFSGMGEDEELASMCRTGARVIKIIKPHMDNEVIYHKIKQAEECNAFAVGMDIDHAFNRQGEYDTVCGLTMRPKSIQEMKAFVAATKLPFIIKGVLSEQDAKLCLEVGAKGIVVSHHHGIMDYAVPPLMILPKIAKVINGQIPIFVDCGIESGMDVFKALALGANAVCVGRAIMGPLGKDKEDGVKDTILRMNQELRGVMARTGFKTVEQIDDSVIWYRK